MNLFPDEISRIIIEQTVQLVASHLNVIHVGISAAVVEADACITAVPPVPGEVQGRFLAVSVPVFTPLVYTSRAAEQVSVDVPPAAAIVVGLADMFTFQSP